MAAHRHADWVLFNISYVVVWRYSCEAYTICFTTTYTKGFELCASHVVHTQTRATLWEPSFMHVQTHTHTQWWSLPFLPLLLFDTKLHGLALNGRNHSRGTWSVLSCLVYFSFCFLGVWNCLFVVQVSWVEQRTDCATRSQSCSSIGEYRQQLARESLVKVFCVCEMSIFPIADLN